MQKIKCLLFMGVLALVTLLANITAAGACGVFHYQPELPESLAQKYD
ncbi:MAG: cyclic lactone autoinducer peptide [Firmicutes bacterium]|nr:cyclic lactone autoinducer peptide [Bacillota bacterium]